MAFRPAYKPPVKKPDPVRRSCLGLFYFLALAVIAYGLYTLVASRVAIRDTLQLGSEVPDVALTALGSLIILVILHLMVLFAVALVRGARTDDARR
jgi:hypothetical protein